MIENLEIIKEGTVMVNVVSLCVLHLVDNLIDIDFLLRHLVHLLNLFEVSSETIIVLLGVLELRALRKECGKNGDRQECSTAEDPQEHVDVPIVLEEDAAEHES